MDRMKNPAKKEEYRRCTKCRFVDYADEMGTDFACTRCGHPTEPVVQEGATVTAGKLGT